VDLKLTIGVEDLKSLNFPKQHILLITIRNLVLTITKEDLKFPLYLEHNLTFKISIKLLRSRNYLQNQQIDQLKIINSYQTQAFKYSIKMQIHNNL